MPDVWDPVTETVDDEEIVGTVAFNSTPMLGGRHYAIVRVPVPDSDPPTTAELAVYIDAPARPGTKVILPRDLKFGVVPATWRAQ